MIAISPETILMPIEIACRLAETRDTGVPA